MRSSSSATASSSSKKGRIIASGTIAEITRGGSSYEIVVADVDRAAALLRALDGVREVRPGERGLEVVAGPDRGEELNRALVARGCTRARSSRAAARSRTCSWRLTEKETDAPPAA